MGALFPMQQDFTTKSVQLQPLLLGMVVYKTMATRMKLVFNIKVVPSGHITTVLKIRNDT